jgi:cell division protein FtsI (penicillin-binding protein 3)
MKTAKAKPAVVVPRLAVVVAAVAMMFLIVGAQFLRIGFSGFDSPKLVIAAPIPQSIARAPIVDRHGRLLASDVMAPSLFADPALVVDADDVADRLSEYFPELDAGELRRALSDPLRRFVWIKRSLPPRIAQEIHDLGLPGLAFRYESRRTYPGVRLAGHLLGYVGSDNQGLAGIERMIDQAETDHPPADTANRHPVRLTIDMGVQHGLEAELADAMQRYRAEGAAGVILDALTGEVRALASLPGADPARPAEARDPARLDRMTGGVYELGSIFKMVTVAMALEHRVATLDTVLDVRVPLTAGRWRFADPHPSARPLTVREIFLRSSNVGAGMLALQAGGETQRAFLDRLGLTSGMRTEAGPIAPPVLPKRWGRAETITISYGHGMAVAPLQFAAAAASLVNGGFAVSPTVVAGAARPGPRIVSSATSAAMRDLMRRNVTEPKGTGRRADVPGLEIGGKTGTAEMPGKGGYEEKSVISSFLAAFPMSAPRYVSLVMLFEPKATAETSGQIAAGATAAPATARLVARIAPLLAE